MSEARFARLAPFLLFLLALLPRLYRLDSLSLDADEMASAGWALAPSWAGLGAQLYASQEGNPLGYAAFLRAWALPGVSVWWLRLPSVLAGAASAVLAYRMVRGRAGEAGAWAAGLFVALLPASVLMGQYARAYALSGFALLASLHAARLCAERARRFPSAEAWAFLALAALATQLHHLNLLYLAALALPWAAGIARRRVPVSQALAFAGVLASLLASYPLLLAQARLGPRWIPAFEPRFLVDLGAQGSPWLTVPFLALAAFGMYIGARRGSWRATVFVLAPPLFAAALSLLWRPLFVARYFFPSLLGAAVLAGEGVGALPPAARRWAWALPLLTALPLLPGLYAGPRGADFAGAARVVREGRESCGPRAAVDPLQVARWPVYWREGIEIRAWEEGSQIQKPYWLVEAGRNAPAYLHARILAEPGHWEGRAAWVACVRE